jgi:hypothetical protein
MSPAILGQIDLTNVQREGSFYKITTFGGPIDGKTTIWQTFLNTFASEFMPAKIIEIVPGEAQVTYLLSDYTNFQSFWFPGTVSHKAGPYPPTSVGDVLAETTTVVSVAYPINLTESTFELDNNQAKIIWNDDRQQVVKNTRIDLTLKSRRIAREVISCFFIVSTIICCYYLFRNFKPPN